MYKLLNMADFCSNEELEKEMQQAASALDFEGAAQLRDMVLELRAMD